MRQVGVRAARAEMWDRWEGWEGWDEWDRWDGRVLIKILAIEKKILPLLKVKNIVLIRNAIIEYGDCRTRDREKRELDNK